MRLKKILNLSALLLAIGTMSLMGGSSVHAAQPAGAAMQRTAAQFGHSVGRYVQPVLIGRRALDLGRLMGHRTSSRTPNVQCLSSSVTRQTISSSGTPPRWPPRHRIETRTSATRAAAAMDHELGGCDLRAIPAIRADQPARPAGGLGASEGPVTDRAHISKRIRNVEVVTTAFQAASKAMVASRASIIRKAERLRLRL